MRTAVRAYIGRSEFADHLGHIRDSQRAFDLWYGRLSLEELRSWSYNQFMKDLLERIERGGDQYLDWVRDPNIDHEAGIAKWKQLLSLDSHLELGMCFWDAGRYEFVCHEDGMAEGAFQSRLDVTGFG